MESARCGNGNSARINDSRPAMLSERLKEGIVYVHITVNSILSQRTHAQKFTAVTCNFDTKSRPQGIDDVGIRRWFVS